MRDEYDFSGGRRGAVNPDAAGKTRITIRLDAEVVAWFKEQAHKAGGGHYQAMINTALKQHIDIQDMEAVLRRVIREELKPGDKAA